MIRPAWLMPGPRPRLVMNLGACMHIRCAPSFKQLCTLQCKTCTLHFAHYLHIGSVPFFYAPSKVCAVHVLSRAYFQTMYSAVDNVRYTVHTFFQTIRPADCVFFTCIDRNQTSLKSVECAYSTDLQLDDNNNLKTMSMFC